MSKKNVLPESVPALRGQGGGVFLGPQLRRWSEDTEGAGGLFPGHRLEATGALSPFRS